MSLEIHAIPAFTDNYIWMLCDFNSKAVLCVDPGESAAVLHFLKEHALSLKAILLTHHHYDHSGGVADILKQHPCPVYGGKNDKIATVSQPLQEGDHVTFDAMGLDFSVVDIPGHTQGHIAYFSFPYLFCGDTLFLAGCGRLFEGTAEQMLQSLNKLKSCPDETQVYCAHEYTENNLRFARLVEPDNDDIKTRLTQVEAMRLNNQISIPALLSQEKMTNPFLRCDQDSVISAATERAGKPCKSEVEVFAQIRQWKDTF